MRRKYTKVVGIKKGCVYDFVLACLLGFSKHGSQINFQFVVIISAQTSNEIEI